MSKAHFLVIPRHFIGRNDPDAIDGCTVVPPFGLSSDYNLPITDEGLEGRRARGSTVGSGAPAP